MGPRCEGKVKGQWAKIATSTMNGMYVTRETPAITRQRIRHVRASGEDTCVIDPGATSAQIRITDHARPVGHQV